MEGGPCKRPLIEGHVHVTRHEDKAPAVTSKAVLAIWDRIVDHDTRHPRENHRGRKGSHEMVSQNDETHERNGRCRRKPGSMDQMENRLSQRNRQTDGENQSDEMAHIGTTVTLAVGRAHSQKTRLDKPQGGNILRHTQQTGQTTPAVV